MVVALNPKRPIRLLQINIDGENSTTRLTNERPLDKIIEETKRRAAGRYWCIRLVATSRPITEEMDDVCFD